MKQIWKNPVLISGVAANLAIAISTIQFFLAPHGTGVDIENWFTLFVLPTSLLAFVVGVAFWGRDPQQKGKKPTRWDNIGLVLNLTPLFLAILLMDFAFTINRLWHDD
ncbi:MAG TPA: hypothetical protein VM821_02055 [Abditibacteriaceae bacterium]|nr:hypothetical protein [Abditibacteriaceae bacterium]